MQSQDSAAPEDARCFSQKKLEELNRLDIISVRELSPERIEEIRVALDLQVFLMGFREGLPSSDQALLAASGSTLPESHHQLGSLRPASHFRDPHGSGRH